MKLKTKIILAIIAVILFIQLPFFTPKMNFTNVDNHIDLTDKYDVPMNIQMDLYNGCYDCHSDNTKKYPWYYHIQPVSWWMDHHIQSAKKEVNFSVFASYSDEEIKEKFKKLEEVMEDRSMPLKSYLLLHDEARLTEKQYNRLAQWAREMQKKF